MWAPRTQISGRRWASGLCEKNMVRRFRVGRMLLNVGVEALVGAVPVLGDVFDFVWQANSRNLRLVEEHYQARLRDVPRSTLLVDTLLVSQATVAVWASVVVSVLAVTAAMVRGAVLLYVAE